MGVKLLGKIKIHEIAKKLGLASKEVLEAANNLKIEAKSHLSGVSEEEAKKIEKILTSKNIKKQGKERKEEVEKSTKKKSAENEKAPVIIRREVIIEEENKKQEVKKEEKQSPEVKILSQNDELKKQAETKNKSADKADLDIENANSKNQKILKFYKEGLDNRTIAKQLGLGVGEVKLVVDLYKNSLG